MRINRLRVDSYGPLRDVDVELDSRITLFFGPNESGKTLLVESLLKLLLDGEVDAFDAIERVEGRPAGFLVLQGDDGTVQIPDGAFGDLFPDETTAADIRNAFVIRDYDLRLPEREARAFGQASYLRDVTDRIMGSQTRKIEAIQERIAELGNLANKDSDRLMNRQPQKLKSRRDDAQELIDELTTYLADCRETGILGAVGMRRTKAEELEAVEHRRRDLEVARRRERLQEGHAQLEELRDLEEAREDHANRETEIESLRDLRRRVATEREGEETAVEAGAYRNGSLIAAGLLALSLVAAIVAPSPLMALVAGALLLVFLGSGYRYLGARRRAAERDALVVEANAAGIDGDDLASVHTGIVETIETHERRARTLENRIAETFAELRGKFDADHETIEGWADELEDRLDGLDEVDVAFDPSRLAELKEREKRLADELEELERRRRGHERRLTELDRDLREVQPWSYLDDADEVRVTSVDDLERAVDVLERFVADLTETKRAARGAIDVFDELAAEEEREIDQLFTDDRFVADTLRDVTDGNYTDARYDESRNAILVTRADGRELSPLELSQGTYDLLYLTIRLKLARTILGGEAGFLVLDDAFVHSDAGRTRAEVEVLDRLADDGWQVVYFSFRDAVRDAVADLGDASVIELDRLSFDG